MTLTSDEVIVLWKKYRARFGNILQKTDPELFETISAIPGKRLAEKVYCYAYGQGQCKSCGGAVAFLNMDDGFKSFCGPKCLHNDPVARQDVSNKREATSLKKYGVKNPFQSKEIRDRQKQTLKTRYDVSNPSQLASVQQKKKTNAEEKWGGHWMSNSIVQEKVIETIQTRYGVSNINYIGWDADRLNILQDKERMLVLWDEHKSTESIANALGVSQHTAYLYLKGHHAELKNAISYPQQQIAAFIRNIYSGELIENDRSVFGGGRSAKQLDIYLPEMKLAFEFCGLYWHAESNIPEKKYHQEKMLFAKQQGIRLVTIFGDEWFQKKTICENRIRTILNVQPRRCSARQTNIEEISHSIAANFLSEHHIQGSSTAPIRLGAYYGEELVGVMTFSKLRKSLGHIAKDGSYELVRFATEGSIPGLASKMFKFFIDKWTPDTVISYSDQRWNTGAVYTKLGFEDQGLSKPGYWWLEQYKFRHHRYKFTKAALLKEGFDPSFSEAQIMKSKGFDRIWDCGHQKYVWMKN
jgi:hypothetical protein